MCRSRSRVREYSAEAGAESESVSSVCLEPVLPPVLPNLHFSREFGVVFFEDLRVACFWACFD